MAEDSTNPFAAILGSLKSRGAGQSTSGVRKDERPGAVSPILTSQEISRYTKIFGVMKSVMNPEPEAKRVKTTKAGKVGNTAQMQQAASGEKSGGFDFGKILGGLALGAGVLAAAIGGALLSMQDKFTEAATAVLEFGSEVASDIGNLGALALKLGKFLGPKLKFLPFIGSLINFGMAFKSFNDKEYGRGIYELVSGIANLIPGGQGFSMLMDGAAMAYDMWASKKTEQGIEPTVGNFLEEIGTKFATWGKENIPNIPILGGLYRFGEGIALFLTGDIQGGAEAWAEIIPAFFGGGENMEKALGFIKELSTASYETVTTALAPIGKQLGDVFSSIGNSFLSLVNSIKFWVEDMIYSGKKKIYDYGGKLIGMDAPEPPKRDEVDQVGGNDQEKTDRASRISAQLSNHAQMDAIKDRVGKEVYLEAMRQATPDRKAWLKKQGYVPTPINDGFISKDGNVTRFDDQDDILAAKSGGPIDKLLDANSAVMGELNSVNKNQLNVLISIRDGINMLVSNAGSSTATGGSTEVQFTTNPLTQEFYA